MKISLVTETFPPQINGASRTLGRLADYLVSQGHEVLVVHPRYSANDGSAMGQNVPHGYRQVEMPAWPLPFYREVILPRTPMGRYKKALDAFKPDLVHIATEAGLGLSALRFCRKRGWPVVSSFHTNFDAYARHYRMTWLVPAVTRYLRWFHNRTAATFVPSQTIINRLENLGFERLKLWPRGVETGHFRPDRPGARAVRSQYGIPENAVVVGHCGRLAPEKNTGYLVNVFSELLERLPQVQLLIVGDGPSRKAFEARMRQCSNASGRVHFTGYLTGEPLADAYAAMDLFAFSSRTETFGNVLLEAMASGLPVVALAEGGPADVVQDGTTGRLLPPEAAPAEMAAVLSDWAENGSKRNLLASQARAYAETQAWDRIMRRLEADYQAVLKG